MTNICMTTFHRVSLFFFSDSPFLLVAAYGCIAWKMERVSMATLALAFGSVVLCSVIVENSRDGGGVHEVRHERRFVEIFFF